MNFMGMDRELSDSHKRKLDSLKFLLSEQEEKFYNKAEGIKRKSQSDKESAGHTFEKLRDILAQKESKLLSKIEAKYSVVTISLSGFVNAIKIEKQKVNELLTTGKELDTEQLKNDINTNLDMRNNILNQFHVSDLVLNEESVETVKELTFADFRDPPSTTDQTESVNISVNDNRESLATEILPERVNEDSETNVSGIAEATGDSFNHYEQEQAELGATGVSGQRAELGATGVSGQVSTASPAPITSEDAPPSYWQVMEPKDVQDQRNYGLSVTLPEGLKATGTSGQVSVLPINSGNAPPSYKQVMGLEGPQDQRIDRLPENKLVLWHTFPVIKHVANLSMPVALTWTCGRICVVDKNNARVKFFYPNGKLITEMVIEGTELSDVSFLEETCDQETRYVITTPNNKTLNIISVDAQDTSRIVQKYRLRRKYTSICHGPRGQTLVGAEVPMTTCTGTPSIVNMFELTGQILWTISHTPSYALWQHIKRVKVFGRHIIILDWKLNLMVVYQDNGSGVGIVGEYRGSESSPLMNPSDVTFDNHGNILILNEEFQNIHVIDLQCNLLEIIKIQSVMSPSSYKIKLIAFDLESQRLCVAKSNGDIAIFTFENGYVGLPQGKFSPLLLPGKVRINETKV